MKVLLVTEKPFTPQTVKAIQEIVENEEFEFDIISGYDNKARLLNAVSSADALIVRSDIIDKEVIDAAKNLKIIVRAGSGYDTIDIESANERDICVMTTPGQNANAVAELVFGMLIYGQRNYFNGTSGHELKGKRMGLFAFGNVAKMVAKIARGFSMQVFAYSPTLTHEDLRKEGEYGVLSVYSSEELFENCDILSLHMPLLEDTRKCVNYNLISRMPLNGIIVNTARKEVVNEEDLIRIMEERPGFKYFTDVKPDLHDVFSKKFPNQYYTTPKKMGAQTSEANFNAGVAAAKQIVSFFKKGDIRFKVN